MEEVRVAKIPATWDKLNFENQNGIQESDDVDLWKHLILIILYHFMKSDEHIKLRKKQYRNTELFGNLN